MAEIDVPIISIGGFLTGDADARKKVVDEVATACEKCGFFMIRDHGADEAVVDEAWKRVKDFFDSPLDNKMAVPQANDYPYGYVPMEAEIAGGSYEYGKADKKENFAVCLGPAETPDTRMPTPRWPAGPAGFKVAVTAYYREMEKLARVLLRIIALGLGQDEHFFDPLEDKHWSALRCLNYPHSEKPFAPGQMRIAAHTDYGTVTILRADNAPGGLQVQRKDGGWQDVVFPPGVFTINLGDLMQRWTNDRYKSTMHRVVPPPVAADAATGIVLDNRRQSIAFFHNLNRDAVCAVFPTCITADRPCRYEPIKAFDHLMERHARATGLTTHLKADDAAASATATASADAKPKIGGADIAAAAWKDAAAADGATAGAGTTA